MADLEFNNISKHFNGVYALRNASFSCSRGEVHALLGENGAGKSTLLKVLSGALVADEGEIRLFGKTLRIRTPKDAMRCGIGTVYQELSIVPDLTVSENIFLGRIPRNKIGKFDGKKLYKQTKELFAKYEIDDIDPNAAAGGLSLSKRQMIEIMKTLSKDPDVMILDEATSALTENRVKWLLDLAKKLAAMNKIVIFISHRMSEIREGCDNITILRNGKTVGEMRVKDADMDQVISLMLGRAMEGYFPERIDCSEQEEMLCVEELKDEYALRGVNFSLKKGEVLGIGGLAGQGQTELLLALYGMLRTHGKMVLNGKSYKASNPGMCLKNGAALIPEDRSSQGLLLPFSIGHNMSLASLKKLTDGILISKEKERMLIDEYMGMLSIKADGPEMKVMNLSGGNQQKVVLAKMLATKPQLLLLHDITRGVDVGTKREIFILIRELAKRGNGVLFYSTDMQELVNVCDRVIVLYDGKVNASLSGGDLTRENIAAVSIGIVQSGGIAEAIKKYEK